MQFPLLQGWRCSSVSSSVLELRMQLISLLSSKAGDAVQFPPLFQRWGCSSVLSVAELRMQVISLLCSTLGDAVLCVPALAMNFTSLLCSRAGDGVNLSALFHDWDAVQCSTLFQSWRCSSVPFSAPALRAQLSSPCSRAGDTVNFPPLFPHSVSPGRERVCATQTHLRLIKIPSAAGKILLASEGQRSFLYQFNSWSGFIDIEILPQFPKIHEAGESWSRHNLNCATHNGNHWQGKVP